MPPILSPLWKRRDTIIRELISAVVAVNATAVCIYARHLGIAALRCGGGRGGRGGGRGGADCGGWLLLTIASSPGRRVAGAAAVLHAHS